MKIRIGYLTPVFSGPQAWMEVLRGPCILEVSKAKRGEKIRIGGFTPTFWKPKGGQNCYVTPAFSGVPNPKRET